MPVSCCSSITDRRNVQSKRMQIFQAGIRVDPTDSSTFRNMGGRCTEIGHTVMEKIKQEVAVLSLVILLTHYTQSSYGDMPLSFLEFRRWSFTLSSLDVCYM